MGDYLIVGLTLDRAVGKAGRPIQQWEERAKMLRSLRCVSEVRGCVSGLDALIRFKPDIFAKGADYAETGLLPEELAQCERGRIAILFTKAQRRSTTELIHRIKAA